MLDFFIKYLPASLKTKLSGASKKKVLSNIVWLFGDKILRMGGGLLVGLWVARYLGPKDFGLYNFVFAFVWLFGYVATLGVDEIAIRDIISDPAAKNEILGTSLWMKIWGSALSLALISCSFFFEPFNAGGTIMLIIIMAFSMTIKNSGVIRLWFESQLLSKYTVIAENVAFIAISIVKVVFIYLHKPLICFVWAALIEVLLSSVLFIYLYFKQLGYKINWVVSKKRAVAMLHNSWPLIVSGLSIMIYVKSDQVLLGIMASEKEAGIYSAAARISELWYFLPTTIVVSVFPSIIQAKNTSKEVYDMRLQQLFDLMLIISLSIAIPVTFCSGWIVKILFGDSYFGAGPVLAIHVWSGIFVFLGVASSKYFVVENMQKNNFYRTLAGAFANVLLNIALIPTFGAVGSAIATVISYGISVFAGSFFNKTRHVSYLMFSSFNLKKISITIFKK